MEVRGALRRGRSAAHDAELAETLTCPLCMELPEDQVHKCKNGHNVRTRDSNPRCATCLASADR